MNILVVDDHELFAEGLRQVLQGLPEAPVIDIADSLTVALELAEKNSPDFIILDWYLPDSRGNLTIKQILNDYPNAPILVVSASHDERIIQQAVGAGAMGFVSKSSSLKGLREAIDNILCGKLSLPSGYNIMGETDIPAFDSYTRDQLTSRYRLTPRQLSVLSLIMQGLTNRDIGLELNCAEGTVKVHVSTVLKAMNVKNRTEAVWAIEQLNPINAYTKC